MTIFLYLCGAGMLGISLAAAMARSQMKFVRVVETRRA